MGECGLDYHYDHSPRDVQRDVFAAQIGLAHAHDLPLVIHTREAWDDTFAILAAEGVPERTVFHCFTGGPDEAGAGLDLGAHLSFSGIVTFKTADDVRAAAALCPLDRLLVETDAPTWPRCPHRGRPNRPALVPLVGAGVAEVRGQDVEAVAEADLGQRRPGVYELPGLSRPSPPDAWTEVAVVLRSSRSRTAAPAGRLVVLTSPVPPATVAGVRWSSRSAATAVVAAVTSSATQPGTDPASTARGGTDARRDRPRRRRHPRRRPRRPPDGADPGLRHRRRSTRTPAPRPTEHQVRRRSPGAADARGGRAGRPRRLGAAPTRPTRPPTTAPTGPRRRPQPRPAADRRRR